MSRRGGLSKIGHPLVTDTMQWIEQQDPSPTLRLIHLNHSNPALDPRSDARAEIERRGHAVARQGELIEL